ncbi:hypothetical protein L3Y34_007445 [Caenorhabditis briggsae]|uniref:Uncharacterized protein n=2 Tax=Caenorhabditis briggsae TaxID=6238 RepID=A0AAE8ZYT6_CAEBR|nr:hypothetical protein L3Y34_007445 [Caenorhabditis briggsae]
MHYMIIFMLFQPSLPLPFVYKQLKTPEKLSETSFHLLSNMNILGLLLLVLLAIAAPLVEAGRSCHTSEQCDYVETCYEGHCYTIDELFEKYNLKK